MGRTGFSSTVLTLGLAGLLAACGGGGGGGGGTAPAAPAHVLVTPLIQAATVSWDTVPGATQYHIYLAADPTVDATNYASLPQGRHVPSFPGTAYTIQGLQGGDTYWAVVVAESDGVMGAESAPGSTVLAPPQVRDVQAKALPGSVSVVWGGTHGAAAYDVVVAKDPGVTTAGWASIPGAMRFDDVHAPLEVDGLDNGADYYVVVVARNAGGIGPDSAPVLGSPSGRGTFVDVGTIDVGTNPQGSVVADFDGDGQNDLAIAVQDSGVVSVLFGIGDGTFTLPVEYGVGIEPLALVAADFDGDGHADLAVANGLSADVTILVNDGSGGFLYAGTSPLGSTPSSIVVARLRGPFAPLDLVLAHEGTSEISVLLGNGDGTFAPVTAYASGLGATYAVAGDFDGDSLLDVVSADRVDGTVSFLKGDGLGGFAPAVASPAGVSPSSLVMSDFDGDLRLDLAVVDAGDGSVVLLRGAGDGTFLSLSSAATGPAPVAAAIGDFDGDGLLDLAIANTGGDSVTILRGDGHGTFQVHFDAPTADAPGSVVTADFNGDGILDIAVTDPVTGQIRILLGSPV
jgi:hypothetical protein